MIKPETWRGSIGGYCSGLGTYRLTGRKPAQLLFTENDSNSEKLWGPPNKSPFVKDALHTALINNNFGFLDGKTEGTKFAPMYQVNVAGGSSAEFQFRLSKQALATPFGKGFDKIFAERMKEADTFYEEIAARPVNQQPTTNNQQPGTSR